MSLYRKYSGLIFDDDFITNENRWTASPTDQCTQDIIAGTMTLQHSANGTLLLFDLPVESDLLLEVTATYLPTQDGDEGGLVIWKDSINKLEFLETKDTSTDEYKIWRAVKSGQTWKFYAKRLGGWEFFDSSQLTATLAGIILRGPSQTNYQNLVVDRAILCKGGTLRLGNLQPGWVAKLHDRLDALVYSKPVVAGSGGVEFILPSIPFNGTIKVYDELGALVDATDKIDMYGGDSFLFGPDLQVIYEGAELSKYQLTSLGALYSDVIEKQMSVLNMTGGTVANVKVSVEKYLHKFGYEWVTVAPDVAGVPGAYSTSILLGNIISTGSSKFWVKFFKQADMFSIEPAQFMIDVSYGGG